MKLLYCTCTHFSCNSRSTYHLQLLGYGCKKILGVLENRESGFIALVRHVMICTKQDKTKMTQTGKQQAIEGKTLVRHFTICSKQDKTISPQTYKQKKSQRAIEQFSPRCKHLPPMSPLIISISSAQLDTKDQYNHLHNETMFPLIVTD